MGDHGMVPLFPTREKGARAGGKALPDGTDKRSYYAGT